MKKLLFIIIVSATYYSGFAQTVFDRIYSPYPTGGRVNAVIQTSDGGFFAAGTVDNANIMGATKTNSLGDTIWNFIYDLGVGNGADIIKTAIETREGNYIIGGMTRDITIPSSAAFLIKLNNNGDTIWVKQYGLLNRSERCYSVKQTLDGGFIFCGWRYDSLTSTSDVYLVKTDSLGNEQWEKTYGGSDYDFGYSIAITSEGGYLVLGTTYSYGIGQYSMYLIKTDNLGNKLWQRIYGGSLQDYGNSIAIATDGGYLLGGGTYLSTDTIAGYLIKTDTSGAVLWEKRYRGMVKYEEINAVKQLYNGDIVISGDEQGDSLYTRYYGMAKKLDNNGNIIWQKDYQYFNADSTQHYFYAMDTCSDGGFVMAGMIVDYRTGANPTNLMWMVKTDCMGNDASWDSNNCSLTVGVPELKKEESSMLIYPNPSDGDITVAYGLTGINNGRFELYDVFGREVYSRELRNNETSFTINNTFLSSGVYYYQAMVGQKKIGNGKVVVIR